VIRTTDQDIIGTKPRRDECADLPLFAAPVPVATRSPRREARARTDAAGGRARVLQALQAAPDGLTRWEIHHATGLPINTVNARVAELCSQVLVHVRGDRRTPDNVGRMVDGGVVRLGQGAR
jgi:hypothetical protein